MHAPLIEHAYIYKRLTVGVSHLNQDGVLNEKKKCPNHSCSNELAGLVCREKG